MVKISVDTLVIKSTSVDDAELEELFSDLEYLENMSETRLRPVKLPSELAFRIEKENRLIGEVRFKTIKWYNRKSQLSIMILKEFQNKGFACKALESIIRYGFETMNLYRLEAEVIDTNIASQKLIEKCGFILEGRLREAKYTNGNYCDILYYGMLKKDWENKNS